MLVLHRLVVGLFLMISAIAQAQSFTSIQVTSARSADVQSRRVRVFPNGDLSATSVNAITLISYGYDVPANPSERLSALPPWVYSERYDIEARASSTTKHLAPSDENRSELVRAIFRQVLADRFHFVIRTENRSIPVYALVVAPSGAELKPVSDTECIFDTARDGCHTFPGGFGHPLNANAVDMDDLAHYIENWTDLPVVNRTSLTGVFMMSSEGWRPMRLPPPPPNGERVDFTQLKTIDAVLGGLGLQLQKGFATVPIYTVDQIQRP